MLHTATAYAGAADWNNDCGRASGPEVLRATGSERTNFRSCHYENKSWPLTMSVVRLLLGLFCS
jgi:hypothetical protein